ncbi:CapA family protein [Halobacterium sp. BOL4-2]|uniref:CapA family protein n=1 Tax=Halobacterium sp. BOL4-2 TaxID=2810537 RepID=UPI00196569EC|nr:CapA family protein [Halobacterium sp. BOL4-2]QRY24865.1 CapA family protein [Halobacterium sp. BOL4-2]
MNQRTLTFVGDISIPSKISPKLDDYSTFRDTITVANIEGDIVDNPKELYSKRVLFNHVSLKHFLEKMNVSVGNLANNHILDIHSTPKKTVRHLENEDITTIGAGNNIGEASQIKSLNIDGTKYAFLSFGWKVIGAPQAQIDSPGVNPLDPQYVLRMVKYTREQYTNHKIVVNFHWNYNLEIHPQPLHRKLAYMAVDQGADLIVGHHPHIVSGIEVYKSTPIIHSLGNWFIPHGIFFDGELTYPEISTVHLAAEWNPDKELQLHWYQYDSTDHSLNHLSSELLSESRHIRELTPYRGFTHEEYTKWFRQNRRIRSFLPIYINPSEQYLNKIKDMYCKYRQYLVDRASPIL